MNTSTMVHLEHDKLVRFEVSDSTNGDLVLRVKSGGYADLVVFMQPDQLRMLVSAAAEYLRGKEEQ